MNITKYIWGKAYKKEINGEKKHIYHPLICHLIDVAAVAEVFWDEIFSQSLKSYLTKLFSKNERLTKSWLIFLAGIHDIGKATPIFQSKISEFAKTLKKYFNLDTFSYKIFHSILSGEIFSQSLNSFLYQTNIPKNLLNDLKYVIGGHHGRFPKTRYFRELIPDYLGDEKWKKIQYDLIKTLEDFCNLKDDKNYSSEKTGYILKRDEQIALLIFIAGFISIVDWIGSNEGFFEYFIEYNDLSELKKKYFPLSRTRAKIALKEIGWDNWKNLNENTSLLKFKEVFPFITETRPLQQVVIDNLENISTPSLIIIEAPMGEGKTEAAFYLEYYLEQLGSLQGAYIALPTQATANQMFNRVQEFLLKIKKGLRFNLHLLHGNAILSKEYEKLKTRSKNYDKEEESNLVADEWFTYRKRGLISPFGVGTIDQILLSVLPLKHFFIRLFGLAGKTVIIDEVHSYDIYMSTIMEHLLYWLRLLGTNVILLSATLPSFKREKLIRKYYNKDIDLPIVPYPRITICDKNDVRSFTFNVKLKKQGNESVSIDWIEQSSILEKLTDSLKQGGRVAIICNTIRRAQDLYLQLKSLEREGINIDLLHSRFPQIRRSEIENKILEKYGKENDHCQSADLLISTQIIEQSLDLDFDLMISDLAPVDLLLQRMGRLHRHSYDKKNRPIQRPKSLKRPQFWIFQPELTEYAIPTLRYSIYSKYILFKTYLHLKTISNISIPDDLEPLIEEVYNDKSTLPIQFQNFKEIWEKELESEYKKQTRVEQDDRLTVEYKLLPEPSDEDFFNDFSVYLEENTREAQESLQSLTRITSPSVNLICLYNYKDNYYLDQEKTLFLDLKKKPDLDLAKMILDYMVRISHYQIFRYFFDKGNSIPSVWKKNRLVHNIHYVILEKNDDNEFFFRVNQYNVFINKELGLYIKKEEVK